MSGLLERDEERCAQSIPDVNSFGIEEETTTARMSVPDACASERSSNSLPYARQYL